MVCPSAPVTQHSRARDGRGTHPEAAHCLAARAHLLDKVERSGRGLARPGLEPRGGGLGSRALEHIPLTHGHVLQQRSSSGTRPG